MLEVHGAAIRDVKQIEYKLLGKWGKKHLSVDVVYIDIFIIYERKLWVTITDGKRYDDYTSTTYNDNVCTGAGKVYYIHIPLVANAIPYNMYMVTYQKHT